MTHLERETRMEEWWVRNELHVKHSGLTFSGHACVTGLTDSPKAAEGRSNLELLLLNYDLQGRYTMPPVSDWYRGFLGRLPVIPRPKKVKNKRKQLERLLRDRCMMHAAIARRLAEDLTHLTAQDY